MSNIIKLLFIVFLNGYNLSIVNVGSNMTLYKTTNIIINIWIISNNVLFIIIYKEINLIYFKQIKQKNLNI